MCSEFELVDDDDDALRDSVFQPLERFNQKHVGTSGYRPLGVAVCEDGRRNGAGLWAHTANDWLVIELLFVPENLRGQGLGARLVAQAEAEAITRGCHSAWLDTFAFQARGFYEKLGYTVFGTLEDYPESTARYFMKKRLVKPHRQDDVTEKLNAVYERRDAQSVLDSPLARWQSASLDEES